jgi:hypothetical protein
VERRTAGEFRALDHQHVALPQQREVVRHAGAPDAATDDDDTGGRGEHGTMIERPTRRHKP